MPLAPRAIPYTLPQLLELARQQDPDIQSQQQMVKQANRKWNCRARNSALTSMCSTLAAHQRRYSRLLHGHVRDQSS